MEIMHIACGNDTWVTVWSALSEQILSNEGRLIEIRPGGRGWLILRLTTAGDFEFVSDPPGMKYVYWIDDDPNPRGTGVEDFLANQQQSRIKRLVDDNGRFIGCAYLNNGD